MKNKMPKIDLSKYNDQERIPESVEQIILNGLIFYSGNAKKVSNYFNIDIDIVNTIYIKWYPHLTKAMTMKEKSEDLDNAINIGIELMKDHLAEVKQNRDNSSSKVMSQTLTRNVNSIVDRLVTIKENSSRAYDTITNKLIDSVVKVKTLEKLESGVIEDNSDYDINVNTVADLLDPYVGYTDNGTAKKRVEAYNKITQEVLTFNSVTECGEHFGCHVQYISKKIKNKKPYKNEWIFRYLDK